jgi:hypothetical protein
MAAMTSAERQAKRREQYRQMRAALEAVLEAGSLKQAKAIALEALTTPAAAPRPAGGLPATGRTPAA